ncbi:MAG: RNA methyltransferase [Candidatus Improbicoccus devescovinae]|nr:MAG: RNA methyltransferase [Candidatus Improbicoccus devescovinae]
MSFDCCFVTSRNNKKIKNIFRLLRDVSFRNSSGMFVVESIKLMLEMLGFGIKILESYFDEKLFGNLEVAVREKILSSSDRSYVVKAGILNSVASVVSCSGAVFVCQQPVELEKCEFLTKKNANNIFFVENIQNPLNFGSIIRSCYAFGVRYIFASKTCCDAYNPKVIRASSGLVLRTTVSYVENFLEYLLELKQENFKIFGLTPHGSNENIEILSKVDSYSKNIILVGNEGVGLTSKSLETCDVKLRIPMYKNVESLNVSVTVGIVLWELYKNKFKK